MWKMRSGFSAKQFDMFVNHFFYKNVIENYDPFKLFVCPYSVWFFLEFPNQFLHKAKGDSYTTMLRSNSTIEVKRTDNIYGKSQFLDTKTINKLKLPIVDEDTIKTIFSFKFNDGSPAILLYPDDIVIKKFQVIDDNNNMRDFKEIEDKYKPLLSLIINGQIRFN